jgi:hypothetical protein
MHDMHDNISQPWYLREQAPELSTILWEVIWPFLLGDPQDPVASVNTLDGSEFECPS